MLQLLPERLTCRVCEAQISALANRLVDTPTPQPSSPERRALRVQNDNCKAFLISQKHQVWAMEDERVMAGLEFDNAYGVQLGAATTDLPANEGEACSRHWPCPSLTTRTT